MNRLVFPMLLAGLLLAGAARAQTAQAATTPAPAAKAPSKGEAQALRIFGMLDSNGDGRISREEGRVAFRLKPSLAEDFRKTDANNDGYLTQAEIRAEADRQRAERQARRQREAAQAAAAAPAPGAGSKGAAPARAPMSGR